ncbi:MAG: FtsQ-type POTRA domain-containing protein [Gemmatimonadota bacterium]|nr:FtsQ-type POTRA domain-containing protein [Gemmatimonadota bacterium]
MRNQLRVLVTTLVLAAAWVTVPRVTESVRSWEGFVVKEVSFKGLRYLTREEALSVVAPAASASVWAAPDSWEILLAQHPLVREVEVRRSLPSTLEVTIVEREPVGLVATPTLEPVDAEGYFLPIDPARHPLDLPIIEGRDRPAPGARLTPRSTRVLASAVARFADAEPTFGMMVSEWGWKDQRTVVARWSQPEVEFHLAVDTAPRRLREGLAALADAMARMAGTPPGVIDLRYVDRVVVRRKS